MSMLNRLSITEKTALGLGAQLALVAVLGWFSIVTLVEVGRETTAYRTIVRDAAVTSGMQFRLTEARLEVFRYRTTGDRRYAESFAREIEEIKAFEDDIIRRVTDSKTKDGLLRVREDMIRYAAAFSQAQVLQEKISVQRAAAEVFAKKTLDRMLETMESYEKSGFVDASRDVHKIIVSFTTALFYESEFVRSIADEDLQESLKRFDETAAYLERVGAAAQRSVRASGGKAEDSFGLLVRDVRQCKAAAQQVGALVKEVDAIYRSRLDVIGPQISGVIADIQGMNDRRMDFYGLSVPGTVKEAPLRIIPILLGILALSIFLGVGIFRGIITPITRVTQNMLDLSRGVLDTEIAVDGRQDEIGLMMGALEHFRRQALAEKENEKMVVVGKMASGIAHEVNNVLQPILGMSEVILRRYGDKEPAIREMAGTILENARRGRGIVDDILLSARGGAVKFEVLSVPADILHAVKSAQAVLPGGVRLKIDLFPSFRDKAIEPSAQPRVKVSRAGLHQVFTNLFKNGVDAMEGQGSFTVTIDEAALPRGGRGVLISIADTGKGFSEEARKRVFEPFYTTKGVGKGTGLGMAIVQGIVQSWGGHITLDSVQGAGATFKIFIPACHEPAV